jgi:UDP-N-acetylglucosamine 4,6-dehydratase/5-epimerase
VKNKNIVVTITGGTGSFGSTMVKHLLQKNINEIRVFSRDESKQDAMRTQLKDERVRFFLGDVRDYESTAMAIKGSDYVFHAAALKQVPSCEFFPMQAVETNIKGSQNVLNASLNFGVKTVVCLSTDKAVYPINAMGMSKALMEKVAQSFARNNSNSNTKIAITRYGNVMMSRGSVIPLFLNQIQSEKEITVTDENMTRFMMSLSESVELVEYAFENANTGDLFVKKANGASVKTLVEALKLVENIKETVLIKNIGIRHGEKMHEVLLGSEESSRSEDLGEYFKVPLDSRSLDYQIYFEKGHKKSELAEGFTSNNTIQLSAEKLASIISNLPEYKKFKGSL